EIRLRSAFRALAAFERGEFIVGAMKVDDRDRTRWITAFASHWTGDRRDGRDAVRKLRGEAIGHDGAVRHARGVDALAGDLRGFFQLIDDCRRKGDIVNLVLHCITAAVAAVPCERRFELAGPVWIDNQKSSLIGELI